MKKSTEHDRSFVPREDGEPDDHYECKVIIGEDYLRQAGYYVQYEVYFPVNLAASPTIGELYQNDKGRHIRNYKVDILGTRKLRGRDEERKVVEIDGTSHSTENRKEKDAIRDIVITEMHKTNPKYPSEIIRFETCEIIRAYVQSGRKAKRKKMGPLLTRTEIAAKLGLI